MKNTKFVLPLFLATSLCAHAIERPADEAAEKLPVPKLKQEKTAPDQAIPDQAEDAMPWLGVGGNPIDEVLAAHLNLKNGVLLELVAPGSPAADAGLNSNDIITSVDGQAVDSQENLRQAILKHKTGDAITLGLIQKGKVIEKKITLQERPGNLPGQFQLLPDLNAQGLPQLNNQGLPNALRQEIERKVREMQQAQPGAKLDNLNQLEQRLNDLLKQLPKDAKPGINLNMNLQTTMMFKDNDGSIELKSSNGANEVIIRDIDGKSVFEGPYDTAQDKAAVPDIYQDRLKKLNIEKNMPQLHLEDLELKD